jgi:predicted glycosyltransferase
MEASDIVVSMGGYNTVTEVLSLGKKSVIVPRVKPALEQLIRAERLSQLGLVKMVHPDDITPQSLIETVLAQLKDSHSHLPAVSHLDLDALPRINRHIINLLYGAQSDKVVYGYPKFFQPFLTTAV